MHARAVFRPFPHPSCDENICYLIIMLLCRLKKPHLAFFEYASSRTLLFPDSFNYYAHIPFDRTQVAKNFS